MAYEFPTHRRFVHSSCDVDLDSGGFLFFFLFFLIFIFPIFHVLLLLERILGLVLICWALEGLFEGPFLSFFVFCFLFLFLFLFFN